MYSGREAIWLNFFNIVFDNVNNFLFGLGSKAELWENHRLNLHNNYLAIFTNFGLVGFLLYYGFLFKEILNISKNKNLKNYHLSSLLGFLSVLFYGFIEVTTFWFIMFFFNFLFFGIINSGVGDKKYNFT